MGAYSDTKDAELLALVVKHFQSPSLSREQLTA